MRTKLIFYLFGQTSGLKINLLKSELALTCSRPSLLQNLANVVQCKPKEFPIKYLGLPLSDKRLNRSDYLPLIDRIQRVLTGWRASMLSIGGRIILTNSVITAIPIYLMSIFMLPKWVLKRIDQIRKVFLWHGHKNQQSQTKGLYMVSWALATRPRRIGGLGIRDIHLTNQALLMKWIWQWLEQKQAWWTQVTPLLSPADKPWHADNATPFWKSIATVAAAFEASIRYIVGNGVTTSFWHDKWQGAPLMNRFPNLYGATQHKDATVADCLQSTNWITQIPLYTLLAQSEKEELLSSLQQFSTTQQEDKITWLRYQNSFSVSSAYTFLSHTPSPECSIRHIWKIKAPLKVMVFAWLLLNDRLTTINNLARRGWQLPNMCVMCKQDGETVQHLFQHCTLAKELRAYIWTAFSHQYGISPKFKTLKSTEIIADTLENMQTRQWELSTCFIIWRERCRRIFSDEQLQLISLVRETSLERKTWFGE